MMKSKIKYISNLILLLILLSCNNKLEPEFKLLRLTKNNNIEFLEKKNVSKLQLSNYLDSLTKFNDRLYLILDIANESSYYEFYQIRNVLQKHRDKLLISLKKPVDQINYYKISSEPEEKDLKRFSKLQTIEINLAKSGEFVINNESKIVMTELKQALLKEANKLLSEQEQNKDKVVMFWINLLNRTTYETYEYLGKELIATISTLKSQNEEIITKIIELRKKDNYK